jgi:ribosomal subunit interface protein
MRTTITARHCEISDADRARALEVIERLARHATRPHHGQVVFDGVKGRSAVELRLHTVRGKVLVATGEGADPRTALDRAADRLRKQLDKDPMRRPRRESR